MKKKLLVLLIACMAAMLFILPGCAAQEEKSTDEHFMDALSSGLEARWEILDPLGVTYEQEDLEKAIQAEKDAVADFYDKDFENDELGVCAQRYIDSLNNSNAADMYSANGYSRWLQNYNARTAALYDINAIYEINVSEDEKSSLDQLLNDGEAASYAVSIMDQVSFEAQEPEFEGQTYLEYTAVVENASELNFSYFNLNINLLDSDGVVLETTAAFTSDWASGSNHTFSFMTDTDFADYEISSCDWSL